MIEILETIKDFITTTVTETVDKLVDLRLSELEDGLMTRKEVAQKLRIDVTTFDDHYRHMNGFPKELPGCRWSRPAVNRWLSEQ